MRVSICLCDGNLIGNICIVFDTFPLKNPHSPCSYGTKSLVRLISLESQNMMFFCEVVDSGEIEATQPSDESDDCTL